VIALAANNHGANAYWQFAEEMVDAVNHRVINGVPLFRARQTQNRDIIIRVDG